MRRFIALVLVGALGLAACGSSGVSNPSSTGIAYAGDCGSGLAAGNKYQGYDATTYCGPASAVVKIGGATYTVRGGQCVYDAGAGFALNVGTLVSGIPDVPADGPQYFGIVATTGSKAVGTGLIGGQIIVVTDGTDGDVVKIAPDHMSGTISGSTMSYEPLTVSFTC
jgi:hypothetical protein